MVYIRIYKTVKEIVPCFSFSKPNVYLYLLVRKKNCQCPSPVEDDVPLDYSTRWMNHLTCTYQAIKFGAHIEHFILVFVKAYAVKATVIYILVYW